MLTRKHGRRVVFGGNVICWIFYLSAVCPSGSNWWTDKGEGLDQKGGCPGSISRGFVWKCGRRGGAAKARVWRTLQIWGAAQSGEKADARCYWGLLRGLCWEEENQKATVLTAKARVFFTNEKDEVTSVPAEMSGGAHDLSCMGTIHVSRCHWTDFEWFPIVTWCTLVFLSVANTDRISCWCLFQVKESIY